MKRVRQNLAKNSSISEASGTSDGDTCGRALPLLVAMAIAGALAAGCSSSGGVGKTVGGWFGSETTTTAKKTTKTLSVKPLDAKTVAGAPGQPGAAAATGAEATSGEAEAITGEAEAAAEDSQEATSSDEDEASADETTGESPETAAATAPAPVEAPVGPQPSSAKKGKVAPSVFDPY